MREILERLQKVMAEFTSQDLDFLVEVQSLHEGSMRQIVDHLEYVNNLRKEGED